MIKERGRTVMAAVAAVAVAITFAGPAAAVLWGATRAPGSNVLRGSGWFRSPTSLDAFRAADAAVDLGSLLRNSLVVALLAVPLTVLLASWAGTALALGAGAARRRLLGLAVVALVVPNAALWVPRVVLTQRLGLSDSLLAVASPAVAATSAFYVLLVAIATARVPASVFEAAVLEGVGPMALWWRVAVPLTRPALGAVGVLAFAAHWSNLVEPMLLLQSPARQTVATGLAQLRTTEVTQFPMALAAAVVATLPPVVVFGLGARSLLGGGAGGTRT